VRSRARANSVVAVGVATAALETTQQNAKSLERHCVSAIHSLVVGLLRQGCGLRDIVSARPGGALDAPSDRWVPECDALAATLDVQHDGPKVVRADCVKRWLD
jgi:hypothetical protein